MILHKLLIIFLLQVLIIPKPCLASGVIEKRKARKRAIMRQKVTMRRVMEEQQKAAALEALQKYKGAIDEEIKQHHKATIQEAVAVKKAVHKKAVETQAGAVKKIMAESKAITQKVMGEQKAIVDGIVDKEMQRQYQAALPEGEEITEVDTNQIFEVLAESSEVWNQMIDAEAKIFIVKEYIDAYRQNGIVIRKSPTHYALIIEEMSRQDPGMLNNPFRNILRLLAVMEYDFDNGDDPDMLARKFLNEEAYRINRKRLGAPR